MKFPVIKISASVVALMYFACPGTAIGGTVTNPSDVKSWYELGRKYHRGEGMESDAAKAAEWIRRAAGAGHAEAQGYLGYLFSKGEGVAKSEAEAIRWMRLAAEQSVASAQLNLGLILLQQDEEGGRAEAIRWIEKAAGTGHVESQAKLAEFHHFGLHGLKKDPATTLSWARKAAEGGHVWSQNLYATMLEWGMGTDVDRSTAMDWYRKAAEQGNAKAQASLGRLLASGLVGKRDVIEAYYWLWQSMAQGEPNGTNLIKELIPGMTKDERHAALRRVGIEPDETGEKPTAAR